MENKNNMEKNKVYISGKISGLDYDYAFDRFEAAEKLLNKHGFEVVNPMKIEHKHDESWVSYMKNDIKAMCDCDTIFMLDNYKESKGAVIELNLATKLHFTVLHEQSFQHG